ncbi:MAG: glutamate racemase [Porticoccaceae bacterium]
MTTSSSTASPVPRRHSPASDRKTPPLSPRILVFDSGVGGLSILAAVRAVLPAADFVYACDNAAFPYGTKDAETLVARVDRVLKALIAHARPDIVVVACNTASTLVLPRIRSHFSDPVVGVVPAIKPAAAATKTGVIGLLGTPGTVARPYTQRLIDDFAAHCTVVRVGSSTLVEIAEAKLRGAAVDTDQIADILAPLFAHPELDTVVLACTHFPLLRDELLAAAPRAVQWIDSGEAIARRVASLVPAATLTAAIHGHFRTAIFTGRSADVTLLEPALAALGCAGIDYLLI